MHRLRRLRAGVPGGGDLRARRNTREVEEFYSGERGVLPEIATRDSRLVVGDSTCGLRPTTLAITTRGRDQRLAISDSRSALLVAGCRRDQFRRLGGVGLVP